MGMRLEAKYIVYKGSGVARFSISPPVFTSEEIGLGRVYKIQSEGAVFLEMAPSNGQNSYDWQNRKLNVKLGLADLGKILFYLDSGFRNSEKISLFHDPNKGKEGEGQTTKNIELRRPTQQSPNFLLSAVERKDGKSNSVTVPISPDEATIIQILLREAVKVVVGWTQYIEPA